MSGECTREEILKHEEICLKAGIKPIYGRPIKYKNYSTPFKNKLNDEDAFILILLQGFQQTHTSFGVRQFYYYLMQYPDPKYKRTYSQVKRIVGRARFGAIIPFDSVIDETDLIGTNQEFDTIVNFLQDEAEDYRSNWFENQDCYVEVWLEKRGLIRVISPATDYLGVYISCSGKEVTWSQITSAIKRFKKFNKTWNYILYLGDFDPQGKHMVDTLEDRFKILGYSQLSVIPLALNKEQAEDQTRNLSHNKPLKGKLKDWFKNKYGVDYYVELDALNPTELRDIVMDGILKYLYIKEIERKRKENETQIKNVKKYLSQIKL